MARANENQMDALHGALCGYFLRLIGGQIPELVEQTVEAEDDDGNKTYTKTWVESGLMVRPSAGEVAVMAKFLKDNAITGVVADGSALSDLEKALADRHARRGANRVPTEKDVAAAMREVENKLLN